MTTVQEIHEMIMSHLSFLDVLNHKAHHVLNNDENNDENQKKVNSENNDVNNIAPEVWCVVFSKLPFDDKVRLGRVCRYWNELVEYDRERLFPVVPYQLWLIKRDIPTFFYKTQGFFQELLAGSWDPRRIVHTQTIIPMLTNGYSWALPNVVFNHMYAYTHDVCSARVQTPIETIELYVDLLELLQEDIHTCDTNNNISIIPKSTFKKIKTAYRDESVDTQCKCVSTLIVTLSKSLYGLEQNSSTFTQQTF